MTSTPSEARFERQAASYRFPYHWVPEPSPNYRPGRAMSWALEYFATVDAVCEMVPAEGRQAIIDVGCGDGRVTDLVQRRLAADITGIDLVGQAIDFARAFSSSNPHLRFVSGEIGDMSAQFDTALLVEVLEHIPDVGIEPFVAAIAGALRDGGSLVVSVPTTVRPVDAKHERHYDVALLRDHLGPGFEIEAHRYVHREGALAKALERVSGNRLFILNHARTLRAVARLYEARVRDADAASGAHLVARCRRVGA